MKRIYKELNEATLKELHKVELEILKEIDRVCKKCKIEYFLVGGTLLGAIRHQGFIPWDDDLDIGMTRENYNKFKKEGIKELDSQYFLHCDTTDDNYWLPFMKVRKNNTTFVEELLGNANVIHNGIFVDIFPYDNASNYYIIDRIRCSIIKTISDNLLVKKKIILIQKSRHPKINYLLSPFNINFLLKVQNFLLCCLNRRNTKKIACFVGAYHIKKEIFLIDDLFPLSKIEFEEFKSYSFKNYDKYLTNLYGDYMKIPKEEERVNHSVLKLDFKKGSNCKNN